MPSGRVGQGVGREISGSDIYPDVADRGSAAVTVRADRDMPSSDRDRKRFRRSNERSYDMSEVEIIGRDGLPWPKTMDPVAWREMFQRETGAALYGTAIEEWLGHALLMGRDAGVREAGKERVAKLAPSREWFYDVCAVEAMNAIRQKEGCLKPADIANESFDIAGEMLAARDRKAFYGIPQSSGDTAWHHQKGIGPVETCNLLRDLKDEMNIRIERQEMVSPAFVCGAILEIIAKVEWK